MEVIDVSKVGVDLRDLQDKKENHTKQRDEQVQKPQDREDLSMCEEEKEG